MVNEAQAMDTFAQKRLDKVKIRGFMCYRQPTEFTFQPGVNAIVGANDQGKSTILAAIGWVITGKPAGDTVESWDGDRDVAVELHFADGTMVGRYREKGQNRYETRRGRAKGEYRAIGSNVPDEVTNLLALEDINFQGQANNLYPMQLTAGEFGAVVNRHCRLDEIHTTMKRISSEMRGWEKEINRQQAIIDDCTMRLEGLKWVTKAEGMVVVAEQLQAGVRRLESTLAEGHKLLAQLIEEQQVLDKQKKLVEVLSERIEIVHGLYNNKNDLETKIDAVEKYNRELWEKEKELAWAKQILQTEDAIQECRSLWKQVENTRSNVEKGNVLLAQLDSLNKAQGNQAYMMRYAKEKIQEIRDNLPPVCPLCGQEIKRKEK